MPEHDTDEYYRVYKDISPAILDFFANKGFVEFTSNELLAHVRKTHPTVAPESPTRIMRGLRSEGEINYESIKRAKALYRILPVGAPAEEDPQLDLLDGELS
jgi:hypothetical protein